MRIFIIEDEVLAQVNLENALKANFSDVQVVGKVASVQNAVKWFQNVQNVADIVFMDVELSDGTCFDIFKLVKIHAPIIITTAYDNHAIKAFKVNCTDYLLKPIDPVELVAAVNKCVTRHEKLGDEGETMYGEGGEYKQRFIIKLGDKIIIVNQEDVAYFVSAEKTSYLVNREGKSYIMDQSLDTIERMVDPKEFFRLSRACITRIGSIQSVSKHFSGRLKIGLNPRHDEDIFVSRVRTNDFMRWING